MQQTIEQKAKRLIEKEQRRKIKLLHQYICVNNQVKTMKSSEVAQ